MESTRGGGDRNSGGTHPLDELMSRECVDACLFPLRKVVSEWNVNSKFVGFVGCRYLCPCGFAMGLNITTLKRN